jgi:hypothetical protein
VRSIGGEFLTESGWVQRVAEESPEVGFLLEVHLHEVPKRGHQVTSALPERVRNFAHDDEMKSISFVP